ncbi:MAG TPA: PDZ domain-containing protein [Methylomirabilota bacterium]|jgi:serine protease Do|nr:PDZ domain-containing protein [Methylomirabilota bacterium]
MIRRLFVVLGLVLGLAAQAEAVTWGWLGVRIRDLSEQEMDEISQKHGLREGFGVLIVEVLKETPAAQSGLATGDLVVAVRDRPVVDTRTLQRLVAATPVGEELPLTVLRRGDGRQRVSVRVGVMPEAAAADRVAIEFGFLVRDPEGQGDPGGPRPSTGSPAVAAVVPKGPAETAGLQIGDVLMEIDGRPVLTLDAARKALLAVALDKPLPLSVKRDEERLSFTLKPAQPPQ